MEARGGAAAATTKGLGLDIGLILYFVFWYVGNYYVSTICTPFSRGYLGTCMNQFF
jgi:hypothetical protein